jgi:hypothetical protein
MSTVLLFKDKKPIFFLQMLADGVKAVHIRHYINYRQNDFDKLKYSLKLVDELFPYFNNYYYNLFESVTCSVILYNEWTDMSKLKTCLMCNSQ